ncbi:MAG TPA: hypothetical protein VMN81_12590 [Vicinamibacterales bacterium]|nr:hypothetical protein [Vicinamibacterales bacterium]
MSIPFRCAALLSLALAASPLQARAQDRQPPAHRQVDRRSTIPPAQQPADDGRAARVLRFLAGGTAGLVVHEAGHVLSGVALGANPGFKRLDYGRIPFFVVTHDPVSRRREYVIASSGFLAQHAASEWLLGGPPLRPSPSSFRKGWLTFNLATSAVYTAAAFGRFGPPERDTRGMAVSAGDDGVPEPWIGVLIVTPAALDTIRYAAGDPAWARWSSRAAKAAMLLLAFR